MYSPRHIRNCLRLIDMFSYRLHNCLVFPLLGTSLDAFLKKNNNRRFPRVHIKHIAYQLLKSVSCTCRVCFRFRKQVTNGLLVLHKYSIVHTDLKPDNIMIIDDAVKTVTQPNVSFAVSFLTASLPSPFRVLRVCRD